MHCSHESKDGVLNLGESLVDNTFISPRTHTWYVPHQITHERRVHIKGKSIIIVICSTLSQSISDQMVKRGVSMFYLHFSNALRSRAWRRDYKYLCQDLRILAPVETRVGIKWKIPLLSSEICTGLRYWYWFLPRLWPKLRWRRKLSDYWGSTDSIILSYPNYRLLTQKKGARDLPIFWLGLLGTSHDIEKKWKSYALIPQVRLRTIAKPPWVLGTLVWSLFSKSVPLHFYAQILQCGWMSSVCWWGVKGWRGAGWKRSCFRDRWKKLLHTFTN